jgi:hypothetical protein
LIVMSPEGEEPEEHGHESPLGGDEDASTDEPPTDDSTGSPFTTPEFHLAFRNLTGSRVPFAPFSPVDEQDEPATPSEPRPEESPFTTPEVEEVEREGPDKGDSEHRDA